MSLTGRGIVVQIRRVPDCPHVEGVRNLVRRAAAEAGVAVELEELIGNFPSPTVLVHGGDVTGQALGEGASCRLDLPTQQQIRTALQS